MDEEEEDVEEEDGGGRVDDECDDDAALLGDGMAVTTGLYEPAKELGLLAKREDPVVEAMEVAVPSRNPELVAGEFDFGKLSLVVLQLPLPANGVDAAENE